MHKLKTTDRGWYPGRLDQDLWVPSGRGLQRHIQAGIRIDSVQQAEGLFLEARDFKEYSEYFLQADENLDGSNVEGEEGDGVEVEEGMNTQDGAGKKRKRIKKSATVEKNLKNINIGKMELEFDVDPLFKKTTSQFDAAGGGGNQFLASLRLRDDTSALMMDSETILETRTAVTPAKKAGCTRVPLIPRNLQDFQVSS